MILCSPSQLYNLEDYARYLELKKHLLMDNRPTFILCVESLDQILVGLDYEAIDAKEDRGG